METQAQLDQQFQLEATPELVDQYVPAPKVNNTKVHLTRNGQRRKNGAVSANDEATTSAMNNLALKNAARHDMQSSHASHNHSNSHSAETRRDISPEHSTNRLRKRKSPESSAMHAPSKRKPYIHREREALSRPVQKPASGQLSRPTNPLKLKKVQTLPRINSSKDKFDLPDDSFLRASSRKVKEPIQPQKKKRGRPPKVVPKSEDNERPISATAEAPIAAGSATPSGSKDFDSAGMNLEENVSSSIVASHDKTSSSKSKSRSISDHSEDPSAEEPSQSSEATNGQRTKVRLRKQDPVVPVRTQTRPANSTVPKISASRVTRSRHDNVNGNNDLIAPNARLEKPTQWIKGQRQNTASIESATDPVTVVDSEGGSQRDKHEDYGPQVEEEIESSEEGLESQNTSSAVSENVIDEGNVNVDTPQDDQSETEEQSSEDEGLAYDSGDQHMDSDPGFELFGGFRCWDQVIEGARMVGASSRKGKVVLKRPKIATSTGHELVSLVQTAESLYKKVGPPSARDASSETIEIDLRSLREEIDEGIAMLSEDDSLEHERSGRLRIQDIYAHVIPAMVFMLRAALGCRTEEYSESSDTKVLEEIIGIQETIIQLCEKARRWKTAPLTKRPVRGPVANKILPYLRELKERHFDRELSDRGMLVQQKDAEERWKENYQKARDQQRLKKERHRQAIYDQRRKIYNDLKERPRLILSVSRQNPQHAVVPQSQHRRQSNSSNQWTREQSADLVRQLLNVDTRYLPAKERYLAILNTPSLQNKLPEHIRDQSLYYKDILIEDLGRMDYIESIK